MARSWELHARPSASLSSRTRLLAPILAGRILRPRLVHTAPWPSREGVRTHRQRAQAPRLERGGTHVAQVPRAAPPRPVGALVQLVLAAHLGTTARADQVLVQLVGEHGVAVDGHLALARLLAAPGLAIRGRRHDGDGREPRVVRAPRALSQQAVARRRPLPWRLGAGEVRAGRGGGLRVAAGAGQPRSDVREGHAGGHGFANKGQHRSRRAGAEGSGTGP
mmetsp:Transcript_26586/g.69418  ORF Transcript_26586/g.69418 Transcript_26586/m.69418 type:complete len:221 (-) Transcript_26586:18-680(-)